MVKYKSDIWINIIFPFCFLLYRVENSKDKLIRGSSSSSKTSRGSYLNPKISYFNKIYEFYLATQSIKHKIALNRQKVQPVPDPDQNMDLK